MLIPKFDKTITINFLPNSGIPAVGDELYINWPDGQKVKVEVLVVEWDKNGFSYTLGVVHQEKKDEIHFQDINGEHKVWKPDQEKEKE